MKIKYDIDPNAVFPNLERYIKGKYGNYSAFARRMNRRRTTIYKIMRGEANPDWIFILDMLDETGMTFEECFGGERRV